MTSSSTAEPRLDPPELDAAEQEARDALAERLFGALLGGMELLTIETGRRLGLYRTLAEMGALNSAELATAAGIAERYAREWLEQQAAAGLLAVHGPMDADAPARRYALPQAYIPVLLDGEDLSHMMGAAPMLTGCALAVPALVDAYRAGSGVPYEAYGEELRHGIGSFNRPGFAKMIGEWIDAMPDVSARLRSGAVVLDAGCGTGWSSIALAEAFPDIEVHGIDLDATSVAEATALATERGLGDRVHFSVGNAAESHDHAREHGISADLAFVFEALHDMGNPVGALASIRSALTPDGVLLVADERVSDEFISPAGEVERVQYAFSVLHCLPATMAESTSVANGTVLRASTVREWATAAGYGSVADLGIEHDFFRFYRIDQ
ncbi:class I SAM-dependent methyltransferase [Aldersonia kunmingensis]|uniref:class I SAM-dependent methyltransferase n=1 Tax=Aldersonia kunmingensis TaxID=408066 RepID=UPI000836ADA7|nr:class I SAM-dependent methyltransferase [Aldersonia kunmingensis]